MAKGWQEGRQTILMEGRAKVEQPGGCRYTESRVVMEGGAREETGGTWNMRSQVGPRPQP